MGAVINMPSDEQKQEIFGRLRSIEMTLESHLASCTEARKSNDRSLARMEATLDTVKVNVETLKDEMHTHKAVLKGKGQAFKLVTTTFFSTIVAIGSIWVVIEYIIK